MVPTRLTIQELEQIPTELPLLTAADVAELLGGGINEKTVRRWAQEGRLPCVRVMRKIRFNKPAIEAVLAKAATGSGTL